MKRPGQIVLVIGILGTAACEPTVSASAKLKRSPDAASAEQSAAYLDPSPLPTTPIYLESIQPAYNSPNLVETDQILDIEPASRNAVKIEQPTGRITDRCDPKNWIGGRPPYGLNCSIQVRREDPEDVLPFEVLSDGAYVRITRPRDGLGTLGAGLAANDVDAEAAAGAIEELPLADQTISTDVSLE